MSPFGVESINTLTTRSCNSRIVYMLYDDELYMLKSNKIMYVMLLSPRFYTKSEGDIVIAFISPSVRRSVMLSPPKPLGIFQPNLMCELLT